jgi:hypothetical protein
MRHRLVVPRAWFDELLAGAATASRNPGAMRELGIGHAIEGVGTALSTWRVVALRRDTADPDSTGATRQRAAMAAEPRSAVVVVDPAGEDVAAPRDAASWQAWLESAAPAWRLLSPARVARLLALRVGRSGRVAAALHREGLWQPIDTLSLPGAEMLEIELGPATKAAAHAPALGGDGRYSRLAGALGADVLARWQAATFCVAGAGRTGSLVAHTLVRSGASVLLLDPDVVEPHNLCGELLPQHEGLNKADAVARWLRPLLRPGAFIDARSLEIGSPACALLLQRCNVLVTCVDDDRARLDAAALATALLLPHLDIGVAARLEGDVGADLRLIPSGLGCLACVGGFARPQRLAPQADRRERPADFRNERAGSLRTWGSMAAHSGLRMLELMFAGRIRGAVFRRFAEGADGRLTVDDRVVQGGCELCSISPRAAGAEFGSRRAA